MRATLKKVIVWLGVVGLMPWRVATRLLTALRLRSI